MRARRSRASASARAVSASDASRWRASVGEPLGLGAGGGERLLGLGAGLVQSRRACGSRAGAQLLGPGHVLVDVRLDGLAALGQLLVEPLAARDGLGVQLGLEPGLLLGVLLEDALGLGAGVAQLALGVGAQLVGLDLRVTQQLLGLVADVPAVVGRTGREVAARLVQLGAQHLDLVAEVLGVLDGLLPLGLQPVHLGLEPREMVGRQPRWLSWLS